MVAASHTRPHWRYAEGHVDRIERCQCQCATNATQPRLVVTCWDVITHLSTFRFVPD